MNGLRSVFSEDKLVEHRVLNLAGVQPFRAVAARLIYAMRPSAHDQVSRELARNGFVVLEDFLPPDRFDATVEEAAELARDGRDRGTTAAAPQLGPCTRRGRRRRVR